VIAMMHFSGRPISFLLEATVAGVLDLSLLNLGAGYLPLDLHFLPRLC
jgi:hypothetical protein